MVEVLEGLTIFAHEEPLPPRPWPVLAGAYELLYAAAPVAVCTLASEELAHEIGSARGAAIVGRAFTENLGVEKVAINVIANPAIRSLLLCGTESRHRVGQTLMALHANGTGVDGRVIGSEDPLPLVPNLSAEAQALFREKVQIVDLIGERDPVKIRAAVEAAASSRGPWSSSWRPASVRVHGVVANDSRMDRAEDPAGFLLVSVGPYRDRIVGGRRSAVGGRRSAVGGRRSAVGGRRRANRLCPHGGEYRAHNVVDDPRGDAEPASELLAGFASYARPRLRRACGQ